MAPVGHYGRQDGGPDNGNDNQLKTFRAEVKNAEDSINSQETDEWNAVLATGTKTKCKTSVNVKNGENPKKHAQNACWQLESTQLEIVQQLKLV